MVCTYILRVVPTAHRGAVVEWLERLGYGTGSRRKVMSSRLGFAMRRLENSLCKPSSERVPFSNHGRIRQRKERAQDTVGLYPSLSLRLLGYGKPFSHPLDKNISLYRCQRFFCPGLLSQALKAVSICQSLLNIAQLCSFQPLNLLLAM